MALITIPNTFSAGAVIVASQHNSNFSTVATDYNGNIDNTNVATSAAIAYSKLNLSLGIVNADISASAAIVGSKLNLVSPGAIGSTTPSTGAFTTLKVGTTNQGDILYDNGTSIVRLTPGTSGQALITGGAAANPSWGTGGALQLISTTTITTSAASTDITIDNATFYLVNIYVSAMSGNDIFALRLNNDSTVNHYSYVNRGFDVAASAINANSNAGATYLQLGGTSNSTTSYRAQLNLFPQNSGNYYQISGKVQGYTAGVIPYYSDIEGSNDTITTVSSFRILTVGGATFTGKIYLYKYALS